MSDSPWRNPNTAIVHAGRDLHMAAGQPFNPPVVRWSSVIYDDLDSLQKAEKDGNISYGSNGNPTAQALADWITTLEGGAGTCLYSTGLAAIAQVLLFFLRPGDHVLLTDAIYGPVRRLATEYLRPMGIEFDYYRATQSDLANQIRPNTRMIYAEVPGSQTFEMADLPALAALCKARGLMLVADNSWGSGLLYSPLRLGADISVMALTKYIAGHSDLLMGSITANVTYWPQLRHLNQVVGNTVSPDDAYLVLRGARSMAARLKMHQNNALQVAKWLLQNPAVARVHYLALPEDPGHGLFLRDCKGANGLLSFEFSNPDAWLVKPFVAALKLFKVAYSWGGHESLVIPVEQHRIPDAKGPALRLHVGLEDPADLIADLQAGFAAIR